MTLSQGVSKGPGGSDADHREVEWQLAAADLGVVRRWLDDHPAIDGCTIQARPTLELQDTYFDTSDWRIFRTGFALRVRDEAGGAEATLKELRSASEEVADRREVTEPLAEAKQEALLQLAGPVGARVQAVIGTQPLQPLFAARTSRQRFDLRRADGSELAEIALDETVISRPDGGPQASLQRVEVEAHTTERGPVEGFVDTLRRECALVPTTDSKYLLGLRSVGMTPATTDFGSLRIDASMRADEVALASLRRHLSEWVLNEPGARLGEDPEALHDLRVASRRLDATLNLFAPYLPAALVRMRTRLKSLTRTFGEVRDFDVEREQLDRFAHELSEDDRAALTPLRERLQREQSRARVRMLRVLDRPATQRWLERLKLALMESSGTRKHLPQPQVTAVAPALLQSRYKKFRKAARKLTAESSFEESHAVRGRVKKLRYAVEAIADIYGKPAQQFLGGLRRLQNQLGTQQDAYVAQLRLHTLVREPRKNFPAETMFLMGRLAERHVTTATRAREGFETAVRKLHRKRWKRLRDKFDEMARLPAGEAEPQRTRKRTADNEPVKKRTADSGP